MREKGAKQGGQASGLGRKPFGDVGAVYLIFCLKFFILVYFFFFFVF